MKKTETLFLVFLFLYSMNGEAATRTVNFAATGRNTTISGLTVAANGYCRFTISNNSTNSQKYYFSVNIFSRDSEGTKLQTAATAAGTNPMAASPAAGPYTYRTLTNGQSDTYIYNFTSVAANTANAAQETFCSGTIVVQDVTNPGFLSADGAIVTFVESGEFASTGTTGGASQTYKGDGVFTQNKFYINQGNPF